MLNQAAVEALYSATYVEDYMDFVENLPDELQRFLSKYYELDVSYQSLLKEAEQHQEALKKEVDQNTNRRVLLRIQHIFIKAQEIGDEKLELVQHIQDLIDNKYRQLDLDFRNLDFKKDQENTEPNRDVHHNQSLGNYSGGSGNAGGERQSKRARRTRNDNLSGMDTSANADILSNSEPIMTRGGSGASGSHKKGNNSNVGSNTSTGAGTGGNSGSAGNTGKKKKRKSRQAAQHTVAQQQAAAAQQQRDDSPHRDDDPGLDPDEPTYCLCDQISYGEMILCDNDLCPIEWFHFQCVALTTKPKGKWFCPKCRGDRPNVMKPKAQFLKELERYNKEKEEKV